MDQQQRNEMTSRLRRKWGKPVLALGLVILVAWQAVQLGRLQSEVDHTLLENIHQEQSASIVSLETGNAGLRQQLAIQQRAAQIDSEACREIVRDLQGLEAEVLQQREELAFYRGIVSPSRAQTGLRIQSLELVPDTAPQHYRYALLLTQVKGNNNAIQGVVEIKVNGHQAGQSKTLELSEVSQPKRTNWKFRFRYFQSLEGELTLPADFQADTLAVEVRATNKRSPKLERSFAWPQQEG